MENREFDDIIKKKLESLNTNGSEGAWDLFKEKWDSESVSDVNSENLSSQDKDLEAKIKKDMQGLRIPFNSKHWIILKAQLESEALFKKKLFVAKSIELLILASLVLGILNLWPIQNEIYQIPVYDIPMVASVSVDKATAKKHEAQEKTRVAEQNAINTKIYQSTKKFVRSAIVAPENLSTKQNSSLKKGDLFEKTGKKKNSSKVDLLNTYPSGQFPFINSMNNKSTHQKADNKGDHNDSNRPIAALNNEIYNLEIPIRQLESPFLEIKNKAGKKEKNTYLSFAIGPKMNLINSPFDPVYKLDPYNTVNTNFNISAKVHKEIGPIEVFAGLGYSNTSYVPRVVDEIYESLESQFNVASLENIKFKTFNVPLGVKYNIVDSKNYEFYTTAGVDVNVIADSEYIIQDQPIGRFQPPAPASSKNTVNEKAKLSQKDFNKGILKGGSLKDNLYTSASVSLGLNWNATSRTGIYIEPRYSHFITSKGIGPNEDKVHSLSIDLGVRYQLN